VEGAGEGLAFEDGVALDCCPPKVAAFVECLQRRRHVKIRDRQVVGRMVWWKKRARAYHPQSHWCFHTERSVKAHRKERKKLTKGLVALQ
jgi:hypothetical protein